MILFYYYNIKRKVINKNMCDFIFNFIILKSNLLITKLLELNIYIYIFIIEKCFKFLI
jgi:hypothetical protein